MFQSDPRKAARNARKHGVTFAEAETVFVDDRAFYGPDVEHSTHEVALEVYRPVRAGRVLLVVYTAQEQPHGQTTFRLLSAREATPRECRLYQAQD